MLPLAREDNQQMTTIKLSSVEKNFLRTAIVLAIIQLTIISLFVYVLISSLQFNENELKHIDITVDDVYSVQIMREKRLIVISDSVKYTFRSPSFYSEEYSVSKLHDAVSVGDKLSLTYCESRGLWRKSNIVVEARSDTEIYRCTEGFIRNRQGIPAFASIVFPITEAVFAGIVAVYVWIEIRTLRGLWRKMKKSYLGKQESTE